jgi:rhamnogalacturonan endolyase
MKSILLFLVILFTSEFASAQRVLEKLSRGLVVVPHRSGGHFLSWRLLDTDSDFTGFNVYKKTGDATPIKLNEAVITGATNFLIPADKVHAGSKYSVRAVVGGKEGASSKAARAWADGFLEIPIKGIENYRAGDASVGDLDGDGDFEIVIHQVGRAHDNSHRGLTDEPVLDAYTLEGKHLWRINLGRNIRDGEHYTQFMVYDLDGDGRAEIACKTADGSRDGLGKIIGDADKDWRELSETSASYGRVLKGPEFLTIFDGLSGAALTTVDYVPGRYPIDGWGGIGGNSGNDSYGNRCDRFLACVAYLDGKLPSLVMCRGVYRRTVLVAWDWRGGALTQRWVYDSGISYPPFRDVSPYSGMGGHSLSVADVDADGRDEIVYQAMVIDDDGKGLHSSGLRHGDAGHISDFDPQRPGLEMFTVQENEGGKYAPTTPGAAMRDANSGEILWSHSPGVDVGAGLTADINPRHAGAEVWGGPGGLRSVKGESIGKAPRVLDFAIWWDGDLLRELLSSQRITKWDWKAEWEEILFDLPSRNRRSNRYPCLSADILGDWREEVIVPAPDNKSLRIYTTPTHTPFRIVTLMHDPQYRLSVAWQNVVYNKPPHTSFFLGVGMKFTRHHSTVVEEGNQLVTVTLGNANVGTKTTIKSEVRRLMVEAIETKPGETKIVTFIANTRTPEFGDGQAVKLKDRERQNSALAWDDKLTLEFIETAPAVQNITVEPAPGLPTIFLLGDSTVCDQPAEPYASWGQMLPRFFNDKVAIVNHAESGESYSASRGRGRINKIVDVMKPGDYLFLQFSHNDMKEKGEGKGAFLNFKSEMKAHIADARAKGGLPVLITPMHRRSFDENGKVINTFGDYPEAVRQTAKEENVPLIDLLSMSAQLYEALGKDGSSALFKDGDGTHHNNYGAYQLAKCVVEGIGKEVPDIAKWLNAEPYNPSKPDALEKFRVPPSKKVDFKKPDGQ